jgi:hypothetical protein
LGIGVLGEAGDIDIPGGIKGHFYRLIGAVGDAVVVTSDPGLLDLGIGSESREGGESKQEILPQKAPRMKAWSPAPRASVFQQFVLMSRLPVSGSGESRDSKTLLLSLANNAVGFCAKCSHKVRL